MILLRSSATNEEAAQRMRKIFGAQLQPLIAIASVVPAEAASRRAGLIATQILGLALGRFVLRLPPVIDMSPDEVVDWWGRQFSGTWTVEGSARANLEI